jgi:D-sedoheptulose 7-phosphate isomerase
LEQESWQKMNYVANYLEKVKEAIDLVDASKIETLISWLSETRATNRTIFTMGNGGSSSTASHWVNDLVKGASYEKNERFKVMCLNDSVATLTAYSNDVHYEQALVEPLKNFLDKQDLVIAISGSGNSNNVINAIEYAKSIGARTVGLTGRDGGKLGSLVDLEIRVPEPNMGRIEDVHMMITHAVSWSFIENDRK